jgi:hypothetical protein
MFPPCFIACICYTTARLGLLQPIQRFPFGLSSLILQYILYGETEGIITPRFLLWETHTHSKGAIFFCPHPKKSPDFDRKPKKILNGKIETRQSKGKRCMPVTKIIADLGRQIKWMMCIF